MKAYDDLIVRLEAQGLSANSTQVYKMRGNEAISQLFEFAVEVVTQEELDPTSLVGADASLVFAFQGVEVRRIYGIIARVDDLLGSQNVQLVIPTGLNTYRIFLVPHAVKLTLVETQQVFLDMTVPEIIEEKLGLVGLSGNMEMRLMGSYPLCEFVVQYRETDLAFVSRLCEHLGISYFFDHASGTDMMVFTDHKDGFQPVEGEPAAHFRSRGERTDLFEIQATTSLVPSTYIVHDYNYRTPQVVLTATYELPDGFEGGIEEYATHHKTPAEGQLIAQVRAEERQALTQYYSGKTDLRNFSAGGKFTISDHPRLEGTELLLVGVEHEATQVVLTHGGEDSKGSTYSNAFRATDATRTYRPPRVTPKPRIHGVLTGRIEPEGELPTEFAKLDEEGRYTIKFFFDSDVTAGAFSSRQIRMSQPHAGTYYGHHFPLKPGIEVIVSFVDGDPDRPIIVGSVPNPLTPSPVNRVNATMARIKTVSGILIEMKDRG